MTDLEKMKAALLATELDVVTWDDEPLTELAVAALREAKGVDDKHNKVLAEGFRAYGDMLAAPARPLRVQILREGAELTDGARDVEYGTPAVNMAAAGELKAVFRKHMRRDISQGELEAIDLALTKLGRIATGATPKRDTYVDAATYIAIAGELALSEVDNTS